MSSAHVPEPVPLPSIGSSGRDTLRLLVIPVLVYVCWFIEIYLLEGSLQLYNTPDPFALMVYTIVGCILTGIIVPILIMRRSFLSGAVNMYQIGFRSLRRTVVLCTLTLVVIYIVSLFLIPEESTRSTLYALCLLYLPTGIASVMVCWVLIGTHLQALVRSGGVLVSITTGIVITSVLFALSLHALYPEFSLMVPVMNGILVGMIAAVVFFSVRDVYAAVLVVTAGIAYISLEAAVPAAMNGAEPVLYASALCALGTLAGVHIWLSRRYTTVMVVPDR